MGLLALFLIQAVIGVILKPAMTLTCLQCNGIPRALHCKTVVQCFKGEMCGIEKSRNSFGDDIFNVGCFSSKKCSQSNNTHDCMECCSESLCNVKGCGEQGYPLNRGSICYNCPLYTDSLPCHNIEFCEAGESCMFDSKREFGESVYTSGCLNDHNCEQKNIAIIGRDVGNSPDANVRSFTEHVCHHCCKQDLCNGDCNGTTYGTTDTLLHGAHDCKDIQQKFPEASSGIYDVLLWRSNKTVKILCDMDTNGGGWTVIQRRVNGSVDFNRTFAEYVTGFGNLHGEFWSGLDTIKEMAERGETELRLDLMSFNGSEAFELFGNFGLGEAPNYALHIDRGTGTAGDSQGLSYSNGLSFYAYDKDENSCGKKSGGGWWFFSCSFANLNAKYPGHGPFIRDGGFEYFNFTNGKPLRQSKMMLKIK